MVRQTNSNFFLALICGQVTLWDFRTQDRYALDHIHVQRIIEIWQGDELGDSDVDETNKLLGVDGTRETTLFFAGAGHGSGSPFCPVAQRTIARAVKAAAEMAPNTSSET